MTNATANTASDNNTAGRKAWPQRFGTMTDLRVKKGANGRYAIATIDCVKFQQVAFAFTPKIVDQLIEAGEGAQIWVKGPIEEVTKTNAEGASYKEDAFKIVYFKNKSTDAAAAGEQPEAEGEAPVADDQVDANHPNLDEEIPF